MRTRFFVPLLSLVSLAGLAHAQTNRTFPISVFDLSQMEQGWGEPHANLSVEGHPLSIGGQTFTNGLGTHAESRFIIQVGGHATAFAARGGVDDEVGAGRGSVVFKVLGDSNQVLWASRELHGGDAPDAESLARDLERITERLAKGPLPDSERNYLKDRLGLLAARCPWVVDPQQRAFLEQQLAGLWQQLEAAA